MMPDFNAVAILVAGIVFFMKSLVEKALWSIALYLCRGEFNHDNDESTFDKYLHFNPNTGSFSIKYITHYSIIGVQTGFFTMIEGEKMWVQKRFSWLDWAVDRTNRFPWPIKIEEGQTDDQILNILMRR